jgi:hypothetical protein
VDLALSRRLRAGAVLIAVGLSFCVSSARAAQSGDQKTAALKRSAWLWPLGLSAKDQELLLGLGATSGDEDKLQARELLLTLARSVPWKAQVVARQVGSALGLAADQEAFDRSQKPLQDLTARIKGSAGCPKLLDRVEHFLAELESGNSPLAPLGSEDVTSACSGRIKAGIEKLDPTMRVLTIPARGDQQVEVLVLGASFALIRHLESVPVKGRNVSFLAAPLDAHVLVMTSAIGQPGPSQVPGPEVVFVDGDVYSHLPLLACIDLSRMQTSEGAVIFVNGVAISREASSVSIPRAQDGANLQVFDSKGQQVFHRELARQQLEGSRTCTLVEDDASVSSKKTVLVNVGTTDACSELAIDSFKIRAQVMKLLSPVYETRGVEVLDALKTVANVQVGLFSLIQGTSAAGVASSSTQSADVARALEDVGFSLALTLDVRCADTVDKEKQFTIIARRIDLYALADAADREERSRRMDAMGKVISSEIETQRGEQSLYGLIQATVGRLFDLPYVRFADDETDDLRRGDVVFHVEAGLTTPNTRAEMFARLADKDETRAACASVADYSAVRSTQVPSLPKADRSSGWPESKPLETSRSDLSGSAAADEARQLRLGTVDIPFYPVEPGHYLVELQVKSKSDVVLASTARCVHIIEPKYSLAIQIDHLWATSLGRAWQNEDVSTTYLMAGVDSHKDESYAYGLRAGLGYSVYTASTPPSWSDISKSVSATTPAQSQLPGGVVFAPDGTANLAWTRVSLAGAFSFEWRLARLAYLFPSDAWRQWIQSLSVRASGFYLGVTPLIDFGWYLVGSLPSGLTNLRGNGSRPFDVDFSVMLRLFYKVNLPEGQILSLGAQVAALGADDWGRYRSNSAADITYDGWLAYGLVVAFGWAP